MNIRQAFILILVFLSSRAAAAKKRLRRSATPTPSVTPTPTPTGAPLFASHASKCSEEGPFTLINVFLNPPTPRQGDKVTLSVFYYAPVEIEDPNVIFAFNLQGKTFAHKSSLCANKLTQQEIHNRHLDEEQIPQDDNDEVIGLKLNSHAVKRDDNDEVIGLKLNSHAVKRDDNDEADISPCRIRVGEHMDNIDLTWLYASSPPHDLTLLYGHEKTPLLCAKISVQKQNEYHKNRG